MTEPASARKGCDSAGATRGRIRDGVAILLLAALPMLLFPGALFGDRALLSLDTRLWPPFAGNADVSVFSARADAIHSDLPCWMMPERLLAHRMMDRGTAPLWSPYTLGGLPLLASLAYPAYYPPNHLLERFLGASPLRALAWETFLNLALAGLGMYLFLRRIGAGRLGAYLGGQSLVLSAWYLTHAYIPTFLDAAAWIPFLFWAAERLVQRGVWSSGLPWAACFTGLSFLGGFPQVTIHGVYAAGAWVAVRTLFRKTAGGNGGRVFARHLAPAAGFAAAAGLGLGLSLAQSLPAMELKTQSLRDRDYPLSWYQENTLEVPALLGQWVPGLFGHPVDPEGGGGIHGSMKDFLPYRLFLHYRVQNNFMENALFVGVIPFLLALLGLGSRRRGEAGILLGIAAFALLFALGTPLLDFGCRFLPGFRVGGPRRILLLYTFALCGLAAFGLDRLLEGRVRAVRWWSLASLSGGCLGVIFLAFLWPVLEAPVTAWWQARAQAIGTAVPGKEEVLHVLAYGRKILWPPALALLAFGGLALVQGLRPGRRALAGLLVAASAAELLFFASRFVTTQPLEGQYPVTETTAFLSAGEWEAGPFRTAAFGSDEVLMPNLTAVQEVQAAGGVSGLILRRYGELCHALDPSLIDMKDPRFVGAVKDPKALDSPILDLLGVRYLAIGRAEFVPVLEAHGLRLAFRKDREGIGLFENPEALPRAFVVLRSTLASGPEDSLARVVTPGFDPAAEVILETPPTEGFIPRPDPKGAPPSARITRYEPLRVEVHVEMHGARGFLVLADTFYPGWEARVDGHRSPILCADHAFRAVAVGEGTHTVTFTYNPKSRTLGLAGSAASLGILLALAGLLWFTRNRGDA